MNQDDKKNVDESYKDQVNKEKQQQPAAKEQGVVPPEASFSFFITTLAMQATIAMGDLENPITNKKEESFEQAKFLIDTLGILEEKTKNNLTQEEKSLLDGLLHELRLRYVQKVGVK